MKDIHNVSRILRFSFVSLLILCLNFSFGQNEYTLGESEFNQNKEESTVFTSFIPEKYPKLPDSIDLSFKMPPAGEQGTKGSCWAWATTYVVRSVMDNTKDYLTDGSLNLNSVYSPEYVYQIYKGDISDCDWGAYSYEMLERILRDGVVKYADFAYNENACNNQPSKTLINNAKSYAKSGYVVDVVHDLFSIQQVLSTNQPLVISIRVDDYFVTKGNVTKANPYWQEFHTRKGSHAMVVVGYNNKLKALKVLNSWGKTFGDDGYTWISYSIINSAMNYCCYPKKENKEAMDQALPANPESTATTIWPSESGRKLSSWFKKGYYRLFDNLHIGLAGFSIKNRFALIEIRDSSGNLKTSFYIDEKSKKQFFINGKKYEFSFDNIGNAGHNPFKKALYFSLENINL